MPNFIPKTIHYCWFGPNKIPDQALKCLESWKKHLPDYEVKLWNEENFDIEKIPYVREAYHARKFAFVTDYVRLHALFHEGGIYMDTDVEILKPLDPFLHHGAFSGFQTKLEIPTGLMAAQKGNRWIEKLLAPYADKAFILPDGTHDMIANVALITEISLKEGLQLNNSFQIFGDEVAMYPLDYFCAKDYRNGRIQVTDRTCAIHHFSGSWLTPSAKLKKWVRSILRNISYNRGTQA